MSDIRNKVLLYRTNTSGVSAPADSIVYGELVMNYNADTPFLMFKDTNNEIVKIGTMLNQLGDSEFHTVSQKGITDAFKLPEDYVSVEYPEVDSTSFTKTESGAVIYDAIKNIDQNVAILVQEVLDDEEVISKAITSLNESAGFNENCEYITPLESSIISGATSLYEADLLLGNKIENIENSLSEIEVGISDNYISTEYPNENFESVSSGDSLDEAIKKIENNLVDVIGELENSGKIDNVKFNNVEGVIENKIVNLEVNAKDISLTDTYESVVYPTITDGSVIFDAVSPSSTIEDAIKQVDETIAKLVDEVIKDEKVVAAAITKINESAGFDINCHYIPNEESEILSAATSLSEADNLLAEAINNLVFDNNNDISNININEKEGVIENGIASLTLNGNEINLADTYESTVYPEINDKVVFTAVTSEQTVDEAIKTLDNSIAQLVNEVLKDEDVIAAAISKLNVSAGFNENCEYIPNEESELLSVATSLSEADNLLDNAINDLSEEINDVKDLINNIETLSNININEKEGIIENGIASLTLDGSEIKLSNSYESIVYPEIDDDVIFTAVTSEQTVDEAIKTLDNSIAQLVNEVLKDEQVISNTLTVHNDSSGFDINGKYVTNKHAHYIYDAYNLSQADDILDSAIYELSAATSGLSNNLTNQVSTLQSNVNSLSNNVNSLSNTVSNHTSQISNIQSQITNITTDINVNGVASTTVNKVATVTISGSNIPLSNAYSSVEYPDTVTAEFTAVTNNMTVEQSIKQLDTTIAQLVNEVIKDEKVIAAAMMKQNTSCGFDEDASYVPHESSSIIGTATSLHEADKMISDKLEVVSNAVINSINGVKVNGINGELNDVKFAELTLGAKDINLSETYVSVEYPLVSTTEFNAVSASESIENAINKLDTSIAQLVQEVLDDEEVMSSVITIHNESCGFNENGKYIKSEESNYISNASSLYEADIILDNKVKEIEDSLSSINIAIELNEEYSPITYNQVGNGDNDPQVAMTSNAVGNSLETIVMTLETNINLLAEEINENEFVAAEALTNLNTRVSELENDMTNVKAQIQDILSRLSALEG